MLPVIVCIDDETHNNEALERLLRKKYTVYSTISPTEGLELIKKYQPSVVVSDQRMPQMTGVELLEKSIALSPDSIRLLLTGYTDIESVIAAINEGQIYRYLTKPWEPQDLIITIDKAYETYQLRQELKKQNEQLKSLDKLKTDFMVLVTHELRTPLTAITSFTELLNEEIKSDDTKMYLSHIQKNTGRLNKLIEDILFITKLNAGAKTTGSETAPLAIVSELQKIVQKTKNLSAMNIAVAGTDGTFTLHKEYFLQIAERAIENMHRHGVVTQPASVSAVIENKTLTLCFKNKMTSAVHIKPEEFFASFSRNEKIMNHTKGTGLGLTILYAMATNLGGMVDLKTDNDIFELTIQLPVS
ncbi:MAG: hybrid sensor histidine kinase/response regulator [Bdellovibrionaceae bacterium]|nr:hybrid sensor histidine kinase/response regulator [Pseudobdellovibrionaceae bacterium]